jgi:hypothetical protein
MVREEDAIDKMIYQTECVEENRKNNAQREITVNWQRQ